ncbi:and ph domain-containing protein 6 [Stylonychia lemnae]|uniref:And ph domain-containing protein 6 n=1 Tax=Stylonychia lemnae TaxID=5949 RepID=A0A078ABL0_STYLE|nr:and ph domain-containing protein 6 [Stylonychia lemnae]|eukprot:CDW79685.1 and ph domain-containing protein 6 [Stylonychia lemnae]
MRSQAQTSQEEQQYQYQNQEGEDSDQDNQDDDNQSGNSDNNNRWDEEALKDMEFIATFLDNEEDNLPDMFDIKKIKKVQSDNCGLCEKPLSRITLAGTSTQKRHHCRKCGTSVCNLCSQQKRRLSKVDKKKFRVCDVCDTLMSNNNFESMYDNCLRQQQTTLNEIKRNINKREIQIKQANLQMEKYKKQLEQKLKEISEKESEKREKLTEKEELLSQFKQEYDEYRQKLEEMESDMQQKNEVIEKLQEQKSQLKLEKRKIENQRQKKESELKDQNKKLNEVYGQDYALSFEQNHYQHINDYIDRDQFREDDDCDYEDSLSIKDKNLENAMKDQNYNHQ